MILCRCCGHKSRRKEMLCAACGAVLHYPCAGGGGSTSTGLSPYMVALLAYLGWWVTGLIFYFIETNRYVKFHALQSILAFGPISVLLLLLSLAHSFLRGVFYRTGGAAAWLSLIGVITALAWIGSMVLWVVLMVKANQGETFKLPVAGDFAEKQIR